MWAFQSVQCWIHARGRKLDDHLFPSRLHASPHLSTRQYARIVHRWVASIGLGDSAYGTHSIRRTKTALIYRRSEHEDSNTLLRRLTTLFVRQTSAKSP
ncbi:hypothetical protein BJN34_0110 [Cupriavidus necator]|uniref:Tyr recombinase domain-containing protein n=1 Tax=Cupriavidus necator TaxID=106590 RepID=A0A2P1DUY3_CUPNE|nr:hypothetical protein BJN34_0110 [Cupriavidus necator]